jgi:tetratricopeptide (TPR) repeat protein
MAMDTSKLVEKAREAVQKRNYVYALDLYQQSLALDPDNVDARRELRAVAARYVKENGISPGSAWLKGAGPLARIVLLGLSKKNAEKLMIECERFLVNDPGNIWVGSKLGLAALELGYKNAAVAVFEDLRAAKPAHVKNLYHLVDAYEAKGEVQAAISVCQAIIKAAPQEHEAPRRMRDLSAIATTAVFEKGAKDGSKTIVKDSEEHEEFELAKHEIRTVEQRNRAVAFAQEKLAKAGNVDPRHLATFHANVGDLWMLVEPDFEKAEAAYNKARELQPTDYTYVFRLDDLNIKRLDGRLRAADEKLKSAPHDAAVKAERDKARAERDDLRVKSFELRAKVRPMDLNVAFALGNIYFALGRIDEAIAQYQRTVGDPGKRIDSLNYLGIAFSRKSQFDLAAKQFSQALSEMEAMTDKKKEILYNLGVTLRKLPGKRDDALRAFTQLYEADIGYKDVAKQLEELRKTG